MCLFPAIRKTPLRTFPEVLLARTGTHGYPRLKRKLGKQVGELGLWLRARKERVSQQLHLLLLVLPHLSVNNWSVSFLPEVTLQERNFDKYVGWK